MSGGGEGSEFEVNINLTALLDVLTNLLFFLMFGMGAQQVNMEIDGGLNLPASTAEVSPAKTIQMAIGVHDLRLEKQPIAQVRNGKVVGIDDTQSRIDVLYRKLQVLKEEARGKSAGPADVMLVLCDRDVPYSLIRRVLNTAAEAGYIKFRHGCSHGVTRARFIGATV